MNIGERESVTLLSSLKFFVGVNFPSAVDKDNNNNNDDDESEREVISECGGGVRLFYEFKSVLPAERFSVVTTMEDFSTFDD
jgi:hypothetical protein